MRPLSLAAIPETVRRKARRRGRVGARWLAELDSIVVGLADKWLAEKS
jgi:hypothetical protein